MVVSDVRVSAAAVMLGLSLAGPQALGVAAAAEGTTTDAATVSAGPIAPTAGTTPENPSTASPAQRSGRSARSAVTSSSRATERAVLAPAAATDPPLSLIAEPRRGTASLIGQASNTRPTTRQGHRDDSDINGARACYSRRAEG